MSEKLARIHVRRHGPGGFVAAVRHYEERRPRLYVTEAQGEPREAASVARLWARTHGFTVRYTVFEHGLLGPTVVGDSTVEVD